MAFLDFEPRESFAEALAAFLADWDGSEDTDEIIDGLREAADNLEKAGAES